MKLIQFSCPNMFSGPDSMLQKLLLQLVISMHFQSFIGKLIIIMISLKMHFFPHCTWLSNCYLILIFSKRYPQHLLQIWLGGLGIYFTCAVYSHMVLYSLFLIQPDILPLYLKGNKPWMLFEGLICNSLLDPRNLFRGQHLINTVQSVLAFKIFCYS